MLSFFILSRLSLVFVRLPFSLCLCSTVRGKEEEKNEKRKEEDQVKEACAASLPVPFSSSFSREGFLLSFCLTAPLSASSALVRKQPCFHPLLLLLLLKILSFCLAVSSVLAVEENQERASLLLLLGDTLERFTS